MLSIFSCIYWPSLDKCLFRSSAHYLIGLFAFLLLGYMNYLYILEMKPLLYCMQIFSPILYAIFSFCLWFPVLCTSLLGPFVYFCFYVYWLERLIAMTYVREYFAYFSSRGFTVSWFIFKSLKRHSLIISPIA